MGVISENLVKDAALITTAILISIYYYLTRNFNYWKIKGVPYIKPVPFFGNYYKCATFKETIGEFLAKFYEQIDAPFFGIFIVDKPCLVIKSPDLVKSVLVKDFNYFCDRTILSNERDDPVTAHMIFLAKNPEWKLMRSKLTPVFTSGKIKSMFPLIDEVGEGMKNYIEKNLLNKNAVEAKEICAKYSTDVITSCAFGINAHSFECENADFRVVGRKMLEFSLLNGFRQTSYFFFPALAKLFRMPFFDPFCTSFMRNAFWKTINDRENSNCKRNDLIDVIIQLRKKEEFLKEIDFNNDRAVAQAAQFFAAGFETTSSTIAFTLYELCLNLEIQNKLRNEINSTIKKYGGLSYEAVQDMTYLQQCVSETLRKYPALPFLDRMCLQDYKIPGTEIVIEKGTPVYIPMFGLHYDSKYFPNPHKYDPERFSEENQANLQPFAYIPFGEGPRICIGERFGLLGSKMGLVHILSEYEVNRCPETPVPLKFEAKSFVLASTVGLPMTFKRATTIAA